MSNLVFREVTTTLLSIFAGDKIPHGCLKEKEYNYRTNPASRGRNMMILYSDLYRELYRELHRAFVPRFVPRFAPRLLRPQPTTYTICIKASWSDTWTIQLVVVRANSGCKFRPYLLHETLQGMSCRP